MIIVTSGHVDHGKTALLKALTGTNTAHLPEEKKRGMTIDLGYAYLPLDGANAQKTLGFIDVPGHEKFLANMLAGLGGVHYAMLIVAADEGIAAQTREHLAILRQLPFAQIIVVITKADRASSTQIDAVKQQLQQNYDFLAQSPIFITSAETGDGIAPLRDYLAALPELNDSNKPFRYAIDRVFSVKGAGTVVTGTAFAGCVKVDDELYLSNGEKVRVKAIHAQNTPSEIGLGGQRLALNLNVAIERAQIQRGDWLLAAPPLAPTSRITVALNADTPLKESQPIHFYFAASRTVGKLTLLHTKTQNFCDFTSGFAEILLDEPQFLALGDRVILRSGDAKTLIGGATVLEIYSPKRHKRTPERLTFLANLANITEAAPRIALVLAQKGALSRELIEWQEQLSSTQLDAILPQINAVSVKNWIFNADYQNQKMAELRAALSDFHAQHNDQLGLSKARLYRIAALNQPEALIYHFIDEMLASGEIAQTRGWLHLPEHKIQFSAQEQTRWAQLLAQFEQAQGQPIWVRDAAAALDLDEREMRNFMYKAGKLGFLTPIVKDRFYLTENLYAHARLVRQIIEKQGEISVNELRDRLNFGRKLTVQLIEYFDRCGFLRRKGNVHILRDVETFSL